MVDYFPVLARAVSGLPIDDLRSRLELYEHARVFLVAQLSERDPQASTSEIMREHAALEMAIRRVETESPHAQTQPTNRPASPPLATSLAAETKAKIQEESPAAFVGHRRSQPHPIPTIRADPNYGSKQPRFVENASALPGSTDDAISIAERNVAIPPTIADILHCASGHQYERVKTKSSAAQTKEFEFSTKQPRFGPMKIGIALMAAMITFITVIGIASIPIYVPRLVWLFQHLNDNPMLLVVVMPIVLVMLLLPPLLIFHKRRRRSAIRFF
jgi:hypothetical protein